MLAVIGAPSLSTSNNVCTLMDVSGEWPVLALICHEWPRRTDGHIVTQGQVAISEWSESQGCLHNWVAAKRRKDRYVEKGWGEREKKKGGGGV